MMYEETNENDELFVGDLCMCGGFVTTENGFEPFGSLVDDNTKLVKIDDQTYSSLYFPEKKYTTTPEEIGQIYVDESSLIEYSKVVEARQKIKIGH